MSPANQNSPQNSSHFLFGRAKSIDYRRFRIRLFFTMVIITFVPLLLTVGLSYYEYRNILITEEQDQLRWNTLGAKKNIETFIRKCKSIVEFVSTTYTFEELRNQDTASRLLIRLRNEYGGIVDLGIIDTNGVQQTYAGPYRLQGYDYSDQEWYHQILARQTYISNVFMGYRKIPHYIIAASNKIPGKEEYWILRITFDIDTLKQVIGMITVKELQDVFLVDTEGYLQTPSNIYGDVLDMFHDFVKPEQDDVTIFENVAEGKKIIQSSVPIESAPWTLVLLKKGYTDGKEWLSFRFRALMILTGISLLALIFIMEVVRILTNRLLESDEKRNAILAEAEHSDKLASVGRLAAGVAHEVNNPLAIIDQKAGLIKDLIGITEEFSHKEKLIQSVKGIQDAVGRCKVITHRLLGFARRMDVSLEKININDLLKEVLGFLEKEALYSNIKFDLALKEDIPMLVSDRGQLQQIFLNILNNGIDAIGRDGAITLATRRHDPGFIQVAVQDSGPGIPPEVLKHIFDPFFTTKAAGKGTGLGLSITYGLVKKLGGNITVESEIGKGALFQVTLPITNRGMVTDNV
ncbi:MAG: two-component sensor histidine kinase [Deltaproteobacteria bacterium]|nr:two-component sensor histidine kinase [Deltaproteobacteria bacterium]